MAISFKSLYNSNELECEASESRDEKIIDIEVTTCSTGRITYLFLDLNTAISLRKHLGREIGKLRNS
jgi:hypothetical protein